MIWYVHIIDQSEKSEIVKLSGRALSEKDRYPVMSKKEESGKIQKWISGTFKKGICKMSWIVFKSLQLSLDTSLLELKLETTDCAWGRRRLP